MAPPSQQESCLHRVPRPTFRLSPSPVCPTCVAQKVLELGAPGQRPSCPPCPPVLTWVLTLSHLPAPLSFPLQAKTPSGPLTAICVHFPVDPPARWNGPNTEPQLTTQASSATADRPGHPPTPLGCLEGAVMLIQGQEGHTGSVHPDWERAGHPCAVAWTRVPLPHGLAPPPPPPPPGSDPLFRRTKDSWLSSGSC